MDKHHGQSWYIPINDVRVPKRPTFFPLTLPGFTNEYEITKSQTTRTVSIISSEFSRTGFLSLAKSK